MMKWIVLVIGAAALAFGAWFAWFGWSIVQIERGWSALIAGSVVASAGLIVIALAAVMARVDALRRVLADAKALGAPLALDSNKQAPLTPVPSTAPGADAHFTAPSTETDMAPESVAAATGGAEGDARADVAIDPRGEGAPPHPAVRPPVGPPPPRGVPAPVFAGAAILAGLAPGATATPSPSAAMARPSQERIDRDEPGEGAGAGVASDEDVSIPAPAAGSAFDGGEPLASGPVPPRRPLPASIAWPDPPPVDARANERQTEPAPDPDADPDMDPEAPPLAQAGAASAEPASGISMGGGAEPLPAESVASEPVSSEPVSVEPSPFTSTPVETAGLASDSAPDRTDPPDDDGWARELIEIARARSPDSAPPGETGGAARHRTDGEPPEPVPAEGEPPAPPPPAERDAAAPESAQEAGAAPSIDAKPPAPGSEPVAIEPLAPELLAPERLAPNSRPDQASAEAPAAASGPSAPVGEDVAPAAGPVADDAPPAAAGGRTLLRSYESQGVRYFLYTDGSIDARTPDGTVTFSSLAELRAFIEDGRA